MTSGKERREKRGIRMGTSAKDAKVMGVSNPGLDISSVRADEGVLRMGTDAKDAEVLGKVIRTGTSAKWVKVREDKK